MKIGVGFNTSGAQLMRVGTAGPIFSNFVLVWVWRTGSGLESKERYFQGA
jgi:hypothetical protein